MLLSVQSRSSFNVALLSLQIVDESLNWEVGARTVHRLGQKQPKQLRTYGDSPVPRSNQGSGSETEGTFGGNGSVEDPDPTPTSDGGPLQPPSQPAVPLETDLDAVAP